MPELIVAAIDRMMTVRGREVPAGDFLTSNISEVAAENYSAVGHPLVAKFSFLEATTGAVNSCLPCLTHAPREYRGHDARVPSSPSVPARVRYPIRARRETTGPSRRHASPLKFVQRTFRGVLERNGDEAEGGIRGR